MRPITKTEFEQFQRFIFEAAGITLSNSKQALVSGRLAKRLTHHGLETFGDYFKLLASGQFPQEVQMAVDQLTTNETYFFRETKHFDFLRQQALLASSRAHAFRVWSAASSSGEEAYSIAMVLADCMQTTPWDVVGTDISSKVLQQASRGLYPIQRGRQIPPAYLRKYCLRGNSEYAGQLLVDRSLRSHVVFRQANLNATLPELGQFDVVFLRNVMIYFNEQTKREVAARVVSTIKPGGYLFIGHSESLNDINQTVQAVAPSIYRKAP